MARPMLRPSLLRDKVDCYLNPDEIDIISSKAKTAGLSLSAFLRRSALDKKIAQVPTLNVQYWQQLAHLAGNLNQIAKHLNEGTAHGVPLELINDLMDEVSVLRFELMANGSENI